MKAEKVEKPKSRIIATFSANCYDYRIVARHANGQLTYFMERLEKDAMGADRWVAYEDGNHNNGRYSEIITALGAGTFRVVESNESSTKKV